MENQKEKNMENDMETGIMLNYFGVIFILIPLFDLYQLHSATKHSDTSGSDKYINIKIRAQGLYRGSIGVKEKKMETTVMGYSA